MADVAERAVAVAATLGASATAALLACWTTDRTTEVSICTARPTDIGVAEITAMPVGRVGAVARATLNVQGTGVTARGTGGAGARDADIRATVTVPTARDARILTAGAVSTCLAGGAGLPAAATAAVIATRLARAVRRAARSADTHLARRTADTGADRGIAVLTLAGIAGTTQADRTTDVVCRAALAVKTKTRAAVIVRRAGSAGRGTNAGPAGTDS